MFPITYVSAQSPIPLPTLGDTSLSKIFTNAQSEQGNIIFFVLKHILYAY